MANKKATEKQMKFIWALKKQLGITTQWHGNMNFKTAQETINRLLQEKERQGALASETKEHP